MLKKKKKIKAKYLIGKGNAPQWQLPIAALGTTPLGLVSMEKFWVCWCDSLCHTGLCSTIHTLALSSLGGNPVGLEDLGDGWDHLND